MTGSWFTITTEKRGKYSFRCPTTPQAQLWQAQLNSRIAVAKGSTLRTKKVYDDHLARLKNGLTSYLRAELMVLELANAKRPPRKEKKAEEKKKPVVEAPIELKVMTKSAAKSAALAQDDPSGGKIAVRLIPFVCSRLMILVRDMLRVLPSAGLSQRNALLLPQCLPRLHKTIHPIQSRQRDHQNKLHRARMYR